MFHLTIVTAEKQIYDGDITMLVAPAVDGEIGILTNHHPLVTKLGPGAIRIVKAGPAGGSATGPAGVDAGEERLFTAGGYLEVNNNKAILLADVVEDIEAIQVEEARAARERAQQMLKTAKDEVEYEKLESELRAQMMRERLANIAEYSKKK